jgi:hypothetical protein
MVKLVYICGRGHIPQQIDGINRVNPWSAEESASLSTFRILQLCMPFVCDNAEIDAT